LVRYWENEGKLLTNAKAKGIFCLAFLGYTTEIKGYIVTPQVIESITFRETREPVRDTIEHELAAMTDNG